MKISRALTIAGSAARGGAGIQADLKTFQELDVFGTSAITAIVATHPVQGNRIYPQSIDAIEAQYDTAVRDIGVDALKTGMLFTKEVIEKVVSLLKEVDCPHIVVDPVIFGKMDSQLLKDDAVEVIKKQLMPLAEIITPNMPEAAKLLGVNELKTIDDLKDAAVLLHQLGPTYVLVKGGRLKGPAIDILYDGNEFVEFKAERIDTENTNGAGCTYSAAITAELAKGKSVHEAIKIAKDFITIAIEHSLSFKRGVGPTYHAAYRRYKENNAR